MKNTYNILLVGEVFSPNLGDGVIFETVKSMINRYSEINLVNFNIHGLDLSGRVDFSEKFFHTEEQMAIAKVDEDKARAKSVQNNFITILNKSEIDFVIFYGGQLFMDWFANSLFEVISICEGHRIPVLFNACGFSKDQSSKYPDKIKSIINSTAVLAFSARDSTNNFKALVDETNSLKIDSVYDPVVEIASYYSQQSLKTELVGINIMHPYFFKGNGHEVTDKDYQKLISNIVAVLDSKKIDYEFFTNGQYFDGKYLEELLKCLGIPTTKIATHPKTPNDLINTISKYDKMLGFRMHSHIIANSFNIPSVGFNWDEKTKQYAQSIGRSEFFVNLDSDFQNNTENALKLLFSSEGDKKSVDFNRLDSIFLNKSLDAMKGLMK